MIFNDLRYAVRTLIKTPALLTVTVLTLGLLIGACTTAFSVVYGVLLRQLPFKNSEQLIRIWGHDAAFGSRQIPASGPQLQSLRTKSRTVVNVECWRSRSLTLTGVAVPEVVGSRAVSSGFFSLLGIDAAIGRLFTPEEYKPGAEPVVILTHRFWSRKFGASPEIVGRTVTLEGRGYTVAGVLPARYEMPQMESTSIFVPLYLNALEEADPNSGTLELIASLAQGTDLTSARTELRAISNELATRYPQTAAGNLMEATLFREQLVGPVKTNLLLLLAVVGFVLLIACVNVANMLLARAFARQTEVSIRMALGGSAYQIVRQFIVEGLLLTSMGSLLGLLVAFWAVKSLGSLPLAQSRMPRLHEISVDGAGLSFACLVMVVTGIIFGLVSALQLIAGNPNRLHQDPRRSTSGSGLRRGWAAVGSALVGGQIAIVLVLLIGASLMIRTYVNLNSLDTGFKAQNLLTMRVPLLLPNPSSPVDFFRELLQRVRQLPGVESAALVSNLPLSETTSIGYSADVDPLPPGQLRNFAVFRTVTPDYFKTLSISVLGGRTFNELDRNDTPLVAVINKTVARRYGGDKDSIGRRILRGGRRRELLEIVGVVADVKQESLYSPVEPEIYVPNTQYTSTGHTSLVVRTTGEPIHLASAVQHEIRALDSKQPVSHVRSMQEVLDESTSPQRTIMSILVMFAAFALAIAMTGVYGVSSYLASRRTHEIGIRMAIGARSVDVVRALLIPRARAVVAGLLAGMIASALLTRFISGFLFGVKPIDLNTFLSVGLFLGAIAILASYLPVRRAVGIDPLRALRHE